MDSEEREIYQFLKHRPDQFTDAGEIARRAGGKRFRYGFRDWAVPVLARMVERNILEQQGDNFYRLKPPKRNPRMQRWISPDIIKMLECSAKHFKDVAILYSELDDYYENL